MANETIFQHWIVTQFILPFLLIWTLVFAILEKTKLLGEGKTQINSLAAFIIAFIFLSAIKPKETVSNLILFLTVALVVMFVGLLLWGFISGEELKSGILSKSGLKWVAGIVILVSVAIAFLWASGNESRAYDLLFNQSWSDSFWTNVAFGVVVAGALALVLTKSKS